MATPVPLPATPFMCRSSVRSTAGFSLVEVVLAVGVVAFAFVAILGLIPAGMTQFRQAIDTTVCAQIAQRVIGDAQQMDYDVLIDGGGKAANFTFRFPKKDASEFRYFDEQGNEVVPKNEGAKKNPTTLSTDEKTLIIYHVLVRVTPQTRVPRVGSSGGSGGGDQVATITVQIAHNPGNRILEIDSAPDAAADSPNRNLFDKTKNRGVNILTYAAQIARNS